MRRAPVLAFAALAVVAAGPGCDAQADRSYPGEPLFTLRGQVAADPPQPPLEAAMLWQRGPPPAIGDQELATRAPVDAGFPASFTIRLYQPPPAVARRSLAPGEVSFARANAAAVPFGIAANLVPLLPMASSPSYGVDDAHWVVHLAADVPAGSLMEWWLGAALGAGYHLLRVSAFDPGCVPPAEQEACVATLVARGVPNDGTQDPGTALGFCRAPYRLEPAPAGEAITLRLGTNGALPGAACP